MRTKEKSKLPWQFAAGTGIFVAFFLLAFRPFGFTIDGWQDAAFWLTLGLAPYNMALVLLSDLVIKRLRKHFGFMADWRISLAVLLLFIVAGNVGYQAVIQRGMGWTDVLLLTWNVVLIAVFPTIFAIIYFRMRRTSAIPPRPTLASENDLLTLHDENKRESITVALKDLLFISSERNYALVHSSSQTSPQILRISLKALELQLTDSPVVRCHRSYMVNTIKITHRRKKARSMYLTLQGIDETIPVSSNYFSAIEGAM